MKRGPDNSSTEGGEPNHAATCPRCRGRFAPWFTSCPRCELDLETDRDLENQVAAPLPPTEPWIDIPISADEPVKAALLRALLTDHQIHYEESRRFISVPVGAADDLARAIRIWAFPRAEDNHPLIGTYENFDTLPSTLREIGEATLAAITQATRVATGPKPRRPRLDGPPPPEVDLR